MNMIIKFNKKLSIWVVSLNKTLFLSYKMSSKKHAYFSLLFKSYFILLRILRQFGLINPLINFKTY